MAKRVAIGKFEVGNDLPLALVAGPCALESREYALEMSHTLMDLADNLNYALCDTASEILSTRGKVVISGVSK